MTEIEKKFVKEFQAKLVAPIYNDLVNRKHRNWENDLFDVTLEKILCSLSILPEKNGGFTLTYLFNNFLVSASFKPGLSKEKVDRMELYLFNLYSYLEMHNSRGSLLPCPDKIEHLHRGIKGLLQIVDPRKYGKLTFVWYG